MSARQPDPRPAVLSAAAPAREAADLRDCRAKLAQGSRTFLAASWILPRRVREPACALYAFCRMADDAVDQQAEPGPAGATRAVAALQARVHAVYAGRPGAALEDRALATLVRDHQLPMAWPLALIEGFAWDAQGRRYETLAELHDYAARVAGTVGAMMARLMGVDDPSALARACELGVAMQLSNIARDVGEDAAMGRLYLPRAWLREAGVEPEAWLARPVHSPALADVVRRLLAEADRLYARVDAGVAALPPDCRPGINAARILYREIGQQVLRHGGDAVSRRAVVPPWRKLVGLSRALTASSGLPGMAIASTEPHPETPADSSPPAPVPGLASAPALPTAPLPALPAVQFLVDALPAALARRTAQATVGNAAPPWWQLRQRLLRVLALIERLEARDRGAVAHHPLGAPGRLGTMRSMP